MLKQCGLSVYWIVREVFMLTIKEAIDVRQSRRRYTGAPLGEENVRILEACIKSINEESGLFIQLIQNSPETFAKSYCGIKGADSFFAIVGNEEETYLFFIGFGWCPFTVDGGGRSASVAFPGYER